MGSNPTGSAIFADQKHVILRYFAKPHKRDVFADVTSGSKTAASRPGMQKLLDHAESGYTAVVRRIDRLGRSLIDVLNTVSMMRVSAFDQFLTVSILRHRLDGLMLNMLATLAECKRELIVERVNAGIAAAR